MTGGGTFAIIGIERRKTTTPASKPLVWTDAAGRIEGCNTAFARWLGVSARRLPEQPLAAIEIDGDGLQQSLSVDFGGESVRLQRIALSGSVARCASPMHG